MKSLIIIILCIINSLSLVAQSEINAWIRDAKTQEAIPYVNIQIIGKNTGTLTNEEGKFVINLDYNSIKDSLLIQHVGYIPIITSITELQHNNTVLLLEDIYKLDEIVLLASTPNIKSILEGVLKNKDRNYKKQNTHSLTFTRTRNVDYIKGLSIEEKKSNINEINEELLSEVVKHTPKETYSYTDFLGDIYYNANTEEKDSTAYKVNPIKTVELQNKSVNELDYFNSLFDSLFSNTNDKEYWKIKSGIIGQRIENTISDTEIDSTTHRRLRKVMQHKYYKDEFINNLKITDLNNESIWDFLHKPNRYAFEFAGGLTIDNDEVYIIDFYPKEKGLYQGRMYININNYAILKADFSYPKEKVGTQFKLFGIGYTQSNSKLSVSFEKINNSYQVKYFSHQLNHDFSFNRKVSLQKLKSRFLFDKKVHEIKVDINLNASSLNSFEYLAINTSHISTEDFDNFIEIKDLNKIYVEQFSSDLWKGYPIIQPTEKMKQYKKKR